MLTLSILAKMSSAAIAAGITACLTYGQYNVASGPNGSGLMPPASVLHSNARPEAVLDPLAEMADAFATLKQERAKADRNRAMVDWLTSLQTRFTVQRLETGLVYKVRYAPAGNAGARNVGGYFSRYRTPVVTDTLSGSRSTAEFPDTGCR